MTKLRVFAFILAATASFAGSCIYPSSFYKQLPTAKTLEDRLKGSINGFRGQAQSNKDGIQPGQEATYDKCVDQNAAELTRIRTTLEELIIIYQYYAVVDGSEEALENFEKWKKDFDSSYPTFFKNVNDCFIAGTTGSASTL